MTGSVQTLIDALRVLSRDIYCEDGVATAVIAEAADRLDVLRLTDEEHAALTRAIETLEGVEYLEAFSTENDATAATILRGLLARKDAT